MTYLGPYRRRRWIKAKLVTNPKKVVVEYLSNVPLEETKKFYKTDEWRALRKEYMEKNKAKNFKCNYCDENVSLNRSLNIDHIKPLKTHWNLRLDINNLQILCKDCNKFKASKQNNPKEEAFINKQRIVQEKMDEEERLADIVELREQRRIKKEYRLFFKGY